MDRGQATEVDALNGYVVARGLARRVPTPINERLTAMVHEIESGSRAMGAENLEVVARMAGS